MGWGSYTVGQRRQRCDGLISGYGARTNRLFGRFPPTQCMTRTASAGDKQADTQPREKVGYTGICMVRTKVVSMWTGSGTGTSASTAPAAYQQPRPCQSNTTYVRRSQDGLCPLIARDPCPDAPAHVPPRRSSTQSSSLHRATPAKAGTTGWVDFPRGIRPQAQSRRDTRGACGFQGNLRDTLRGTCAV